MRKPVRPPPFAFSEGWGTHLLSPLAKGGNRGVERYTKADFALALSIAVDRNSPAAEVDLASHEK